VRLVAAMAALNILLLLLLARTWTDSSTIVEAVISTPINTPSPSPTARPFPSLTPTPIASPTLLPATVSPVAAWPAATGSVVYVARENGNDDLYVLSTGRPRPIRLTHHPADDRDPAWSPDGSQIAFSSRRNGNWDLYLFSLETGQISRLTQDQAFEAHPAWSPDGQWLVYEGYLNGNLDLYILPASGGEALRLTDHPAPDYAPTWSPCGRHIAFVSWRDGNPDICLFPLENSRDDAVINISRSIQTVEDDPAWNPTGDYLAFTGQIRDQQFVFAQRMANNLPAGEPFPVGQGREPTWSPDGLGLLLVHDAPPNHYLLATAVEGWGAAPQVHQDQRPLSSPDWTESPLPLGAWSVDLYSGDASAFWEMVADPAGEGPPYTLVSVPKVQVPGPLLSDRVDGLFRELRARVIREAGWDPLGVLDSMWEPLDMLLPPGLGTQSWHKAGRAVDLASTLNNGLSPELEVVQEITSSDDAGLECTGAHTQWRVYLRAARQDGSQGEPMRVLPWNLQARYSGNESDYAAGGRTKSEIPSGYYVDLTRLAADLGWQRVPSGGNWRTYFPATQWWHLENRQGLSWREAMLEIYTAKELGRLLLEGAAD